MPDEGMLIIQVVPAADGDAQELEEVTGTLRGVLLDLDVDSVDSLEVQNAPDRAKGLANLAGWLGVHLAAVSGLRSVIMAALDWASRTSRTVEVSYGSDVLKVTGITSVQQEALISEWIARHAPGV